MLIEYNLTTDECPVVITKITLKMDLNDSMGCNKNNNMIHLEI